MPLDHVPYIPQPIEGQAVLGNFTRTRRLLSYRDNDKVLRRIARGMPRYELETVEEVGQPPADNANLLIRGECLSACAYLKEQGIQVDLVYIDPPFASGADYAKKIHVRRHPKVAAILAQAGEELPDDQLRAFEEKMYGDIWTKEDYLNWMYENLMAIKTVMSENASIYVHLDWHIGHYVKVLMDEAFGEDNFRSEIIWKRSSAHNDNTGYANIHDAIFYYSKNDQLTFITPYIPYPQDYISKYYSKKDERGSFKDSDLSAHGKKGSGYTYEWKGKAGYWICPFSTMEAYDRKGLLYITNNGTPRLKQYLSEMTQGIPVQDLWTDIFPVNSQADERADYATQKPESLLERIISASSDKDMLVADFFGGSGVTAAVAQRLGRRFVHVDVGLNSIQTARDRLQAVGAAFRVLDVKDGVALFRNPVQTMDKLRSLVTGLRHDEAELDGFWAGALNDSRLGLVPVFLPDLKDHTTKVLDIPLINRIVNGAMPDLPDKVRKVVVYYVDIEDRAAVEEFIEANSSPDCTIELRDLKELLVEVVLADEVRLSVNPENVVTFESFQSDRLQQKIAEYNARHGLNSQPGGALLDDDNQPVEATPVKGFKPIEISEDGLELIEWVGADCTAAEGPWHSDVELKIDKNGYAIRDGKKTKEFWDATLACPRTPLRLKVRSIAGDETILAAAGAKASPAKSRSAPAGGKTAAAKATYKAGPGSRRKK